MAAAQLFFLIVASVFWRTGSGAVAVDNYNAMLVPSSK